MSKKPPKDENQEPFVFEGFEQSNTTPVPDVFFDVLLPLLSSSEVRVMLYIFRRTLGFKKSTDGISFNQFLGGITTKDGKVLDKGCGVKNRTALSQALANLETKWQCIESRKGDDPAGDKATTIYSVKFKVPGVVSKTYHMAIGGSIKNGPPVVSKTDYGSDKSVPQVVSNPYLQETVIQYTDSQETVIQESTSVDSNILDSEVGDLLTQSRTPSPSFSLEAPRLTLPQKDRTQVRMDEAEQNLIYMDLPPNVKSEITYLTEQKYYTVRLKRSAYEGSDMTLFIVTDPYTQEENSYRTETFLKFVDVLRQHSSELKRLTIAREVQNIIDDALGPVQPTFPTIPNTPPLQATSLGGVSPIETMPKDASNSPVFEKPVIHTSSVPTMPGTGLESRREASVQEEVSPPQPAASSSKQAEGVSHSQGATGNAAVAETPEPEQPAGRGKGSGKGKGGKSNKADLKQDTQLIARMEKFRQYFVALGREFFDDPEFDPQIGSARTENYKAVASIIDVATLEGVRSVWDDMWNEKNRDGELWWRDPKHLTMRALCNSYTTRLASVRFKAKQQAKKAATPTTRLGYQQPQIEDDGEELVYVRLDKKKRG